MGSLMKIAFLDVDGVIQNFNELAVKSINEVYATTWPLETLPIHYSYKDLIPEETSINKREWFNRLPYDWPLLLKPEAYARAYLRSLDQMNCRIILITKIPNNLILYRMESFLKNDLFFDEVYALEGVSHSKGEMIKLHLQRFPRCRWIFLDDYIENIVDVVTKVDPGDLSRGYLGLRNTPYSLRYKNLMKLIERKNVKVNGLKEIMEESLEFLNGEMIDLSAFSKAHSA
jgi:hypothetical protein